MSVTDREYLPHPDTILILHDANERGELRYVPLRSILEWFSLERADGVVTHIRLTNGSLNVRESPAGIFERKLMWSDVHPEQSEIPET